jgi:tellurite resistance protein TehA-like permease
LRYHPAYWSLVFPIGMYGASTYRMLAAIDLDGLDWLPKVTLVFSLTAWSLTAFGLAHLGVSTLGRRRGFVDRS